MSKKPVFVFACIVLPLLGLSACLPTCDPGSLQAPELVSPDWREVVDGSAAALEWSYPDASCQPEQYEIILTDDRDYVTIDYSQLVGGNTTTWTPPALDEAEEYFWRVRAKVGSSYSAWSHELRSFFTLPYCEAEDLVAPSLVLPDFGGIFERDYDSLEWSWPLSTCIPESYRIEVSLGNPSFTDTTYNGATGTPGTRWGFGSTPPAATQFWWRVSAYADGAYGPTSLARMFFTDPICPAASLVQPVLGQPAADDTVATGTPIFAWSYPDPGCAPEGFHLMVSDAPDMSSVVLNADNPTTAALAMQAAAGPFDDCGEYYWQVAMISEGVEGPPSAVSRFVVDISGSCECDPASLPVPVLYGPAPFEVLPDTSAHLSWYSPGGCFPDGAAVKVSPDHDFAVSDDTTIPGAFAASYDPAGLEPATQYRWKAAYYVDDGSPLIGDYSSQRSFFTGPECAALAEVAAPELLSPADGAVVDTLSPALTYQPGAPGCIPDGYFINLQEDPAFGGTNLLGDFSLPGTTVIPEPPLVDCTMYYWKVAAIQDGSYGPESEARSFFVDLEGTCSLPGIPGSAKRNNFCREGTYEIFKALWTFKEGDPILAVARNALTTYLKILVINPETRIPYRPEILCWSYIENFDPGWPGLEGRFNFKDLQVENPPPTPVPTEVPPTCSRDLGLEDCEAAGGRYDEYKKYCDCPNPQ